MKLIDSDNVILKTRAEDWVFENEEHVKQAQEIEAALIAVMTGKNAIGLAANQVGILKRVFVISLSNGDKVGMFNPEIISASQDKVDGEEGCLSFPNLWLKVSRPATVNAKYLDSSGKECIIDLKGIDARCFLHELDHLNGICFTDNVSQLKLAMAIKKQRKLNGRTK